MDGSSQASNFAEGQDELFFFVEAIKAAGRCVFPGGFLWRIFQWISGRFSSRFCLELPADFLANLPKPCKTEGLQNVLQDIPTQVLPACGFHAVLWVHRSCPAIPRGVSGRHATVPVPCWFGNPSLSTFTSACKVQQSNSKLLRVAKNRAHWCLEFSCTSNINKRIGRQKGCGFFAYNWKLPAYNGAFFTYN